MRVYIACDPEIFKALANSPQRPFCPRATAAAAMLSDTVRRARRL
jgi:hypothetical protein